MRMAHYVAAAVVTGMLALGLGCGSTEGLASEELGATEASLVYVGPSDAGTADAGPSDAGTVDAGTGGTADAGTGGTADAGSSRKKVSCKTNPNICYSSPELDCNCRDSDGVCINAYGEYCEW